MESILLKKRYNVAIYCRLSRDDGLDFTSSSIQSQIEYITDFANKNNFKIVDYYCDDGYSGTTFERPEFKRMIQD
nr:recombinase family protein [Anaeroplasmataceae bacterium]